MSSIERVSGAKVPIVQPVKPRAPSPPAEATQAIIGDGDSLSLSHRFHLHQDIDEFFRRIESNESNLRNSGVSVTPRT